VLADLPAGDDDQLSGEWGTDANHNPIITTGVTSEPVNKPNESRCSSSQALINALKTQFDPKRPRQLLVYIHGYYTSFVTAVTGVYYELLLPP
jgi:hypothetical protein